MPSGLEQALEPLQGLVKRVSSVSVLQLTRPTIFFWSAEDGYFIFNPITLEKSEPPANLVPAEDIRDRRRRILPELVDFGDAFFLSQFIAFSDYQNVIDAISFGNRDSLLSLLSYYILEDKANNHAQQWYNGSYARFLYPHANLAHQRISYLLSSIGQDNNTFNFIKEHIKYVLGNGRRKVGVIIDSTGLQNDCSINLTRLSNHNNNINLECRMLVVIDLETHLPLYYETFEGNIPDSKTLQRTILILHELGCDVEEVYMDCGYAFPFVFNDLLTSDIDFLSRLNPHHNLMKNVISEYLDDLDKKENCVKYNGRVLNVVKIKTVIGVDKNTNEEVEGYIYLCRDLKNHMTQALNLLKKEKLDKMTAAEVSDALKQAGIFALISTKELPKEESVPKYYVRQNVEQVFDYAKNYGKILPLREHTMATLAGHILLSFIATFIIMLIKFRLNNLDVNLLYIPERYINDDDRTNPNFIETQSTGTFYQQTPQKNINKESTITLFMELRNQKSRVFQGKIIPTEPTKEAKDFYAAFQLPSPQFVKRNGEELTPIYKNEKPGLSKALCFTQKTALSDEEILKGRKKETNQVKENQHQSNQLKEDIDLKKQIESEGIDPESIKGKKRFEELKNERTQASTLGTPKRPGRPKSQETLTLEQRVQDEGLDPNSPEGKK